MSETKAASVSPHSSSRKHLVVGICVTLLMVAVAFMEPGFLQSLELKLLDLRFSLRGEVAPSGQVAIVDIDDRSLNRLGKWPWKRAVFADLLAQLNDSGARVVAFDIYFQQDAENSADENDRLFAKQMAQMGNVILPVYFNLNKQESINNAAASGDTFAFPHTTNMEVLNQFATIKGYDLFTSAESLNQGAYGVGHINMVPDRDGITRKDITAIEFQGNFYPSLGLKAIQSYYSNTQDTLTLDGAKGISAGERFIPVIPTAMGGAMVWGAKHINYRGGYRTFSYYSVADVLDKRYPVNAFSDKIVLIGATSPGLFDTIASPFSNVFPGIERHANVIDNILNEDFLARPVSAQVLVIITCLVFGLLIAFLFPRIDTKPQIFTLLSLSLGYFAVSLIAFSKFNVWIDMLSPILTLWVVALPMLFLLLSKSKKEQAETMEESLEATKMLGLSFMEKGMLEMAYDNLAKLPNTPESMRILYSLANELVRKRKTSLASQIYRDLYREDNTFEDVATRLRDLGVTIVEEPAERSVEGTLFSENITSGDQTEGLKQGQTLGRYEIEKRLGQGAMGIVYLCKDPTLERPVAIKTFDFGKLADEGELAKIKTDFIREAKFAGKLNHPNIVTIFDAGEDWDLSYIAMEIIEGKELQENCTRANLLPMADVLKTIATLARALDYAHQGGVVHRDIKPANIMVTREGTLKIMDFGIALIKGEIATIAGTPNYMAPEQFKSGEIDGRTDLYALGIIFYEMLTGKKPFQASDMAVLKDKIINQPVSDVIKSEVPGPSAIHAIIESLLEKDKENRYATGAELAIAVEKIEVTGDVLETSNPAAEKATLGDHDKTMVDEATVAFEEKTVVDMDPGTPKTPEDADKTIIDPG